MTGTPRPRMVRAPARAACHPSILPRNSYSTASAVVTRSAWPVSQPRSPADFLNCTPVIWSSGISRAPCRVRAYVPA